MKKLILSTALIGTLLLTAACSSDELDSPKTAGAMTFTVEIPGGFQSRAYSDGTTATSLTAYAYDIALGSEAEPVRTENAEFKDGNLTTTVTFNLINGHEYDIVFLATSGENSGITYTPSARTFKVNYGNEGNRESLDAFYATLKCQPADGQTRNVQLYRPFAQLNIGTDDKTAYETDLKGGTISSVTVSVEKAYTVFDLMAEDVDANETTDVTFTSSELPTGEFTVTAAEGKTPYEYLAMNYILAPKNKGIFNVKMHVNEEKDIDYPSIPMRQNYRTNIYGSLLTKNNIYNVEIKPGFNENDYNIDPVEVGKAIVDVKMFSTLAEAINYVKEQNMTTAEIALGAGDFSASDLVGLSGISGTFTVKGQGVSTMLNVSGAVTLANTNIKFQTLQLKMPGSNYTGFQHTASETYDGCIIENLLVTYGTDANFTNCTFVRSEDNNGYNVQGYGSARVTFENCEFNASRSVLLYHEGDEEKTFTLTNCKFNGTPHHDGKAAIEVDCQYVKTKKYTININNCVAENYDLGLLSNNMLWNIKKGTRYELYVNGEKTEQGLTTDGGSNYYVNNGEGLVALAKLSNGYEKDATTKFETFSGKTVTLNNDIDMSGIDFTPIGVYDKNEPTKAFTGVFEGNNKTISNLKVTDNNGENSYAGLFGRFKGTVKNLIIDGADIQSNHYAGGIVAYANNSMCVITDCTVKNSTIVSRDYNTENGDKVGGIVGYLCTAGQECNISNNTVSNTTVEGYRHVGGIAGILNYNHTASSYNFTSAGNKVENCTLVQDLKNNYKNLVPGKLIDPMQGEALNADKNSNKKIAGTSANISYVFKNYTNTETSFAGIQTLDVDGDITIDNFDVQNIIIKAVNKKSSHNTTVKNSKITCAKTNPGDKNPARFGIYYVLDNCNDKVNLTVENTVINGSWGHGIYVQGNNTEQNIVVKGCSFDDWGKKETAEKDIKTSAAVKINNVANISNDEANRAAYANEFIKNNNNMFDATTLGTGRVKLNLSTNVSGSTLEYTEFE